MLGSPRASIDAKDPSKGCNEYSLQLNRWFLKPIGAWPDSATGSNLEKILAKVLIFACSFLMASTTIPCALNIFYEEEDVQLKLKGLGPMSHWLMGSLNYCSLLLRGGDILRCVAHMEMDWRLAKSLEDREVMMRHAKIGRFVAGFCAMFMHCGVFSYSIVVGLFPDAAVVGNETIAIHQPPCPFYNRIWNSSCSPANEIILGSQFLSGFIVNSTTVGACSLAAVFALHACGQISLLMRRLDELVGAEKNRESTHQRLAHIVEHHLRVLRFVSRIEKVMHRICLVEIMGCTLNMCLLGYYFITEWNKVATKILISYIILYLSMTFNIFTFCFIGEILTEQCKKIGETAYMINWYYLPHRTALGLILIISRSSVVIKVTAGKLIHLSIPTFGDVMKTSVVYLNILRTMTT